MDEKIIKIVNETRWADGQEVRSRLEDITYNPMRSQEEFVMRLVRENAKTLFGRDHRFEGIHNMADFRCYLPLTTYDDYSAYIERVAKGERNVLTAYLTEHISTFDGQKQLPQSRWSVQTSYDYSFCAGFYLAGNYGYLTEGMTLNLVDNNVERLSSGMTIGNLLGRLLVKRDLDSKQIYAIPVDIAGKQDQAEYRYLQALNALRKNNI